MRRRACSSAALLRSAAIALVPSLALLFGACSGDDGAPSAPGGAEDGGANGEGGTVGRDGESGADGSTEPEPTGAPAVQFIGRFDTRDEAGPTCAWPGCRVLARVEGTTVSVRLKEINASWMEGAPSEWDVAIDGAWKPKLVLVPGEKTYELATGLAGGKHVVELYKRSEAQNGATQFLGFDFGGGTMLAPPNRKGRRVEIVGDSAAAGFGVEGVGQGPDCPGPDWGATWQNFRKSLGARLGEGLDAEVMGTVYSGKGMAKNIWHPDTETMPVIFPRANPNEGASAWDFKSWIADVVVVMIGGNDFAVGQPDDEGPATLAQFSNAYEGFVKTLREKYPPAHLFLVTSPSVTDADPPGRNTRTNVMNGIQSVVTKRKQANDTRVYALTPPAAGSSELTGCNGHGSPEFHQRVANDLAGPIKEKTGW